MSADGESVRVAARFQINPESVERPQRNRPRRTRRATLKRVRVPYPPPLSGPDQPNLRSPDRGGQSGYLQAHVERPVERLCNAAAHPFEVRQLRRSESMSYRTHPPARRALSSGLFVPTAIVLSILPTSFAHDT